MVCCSCVYKTWVGDMTASTAYDDVRDLLGDTDDQCWLCDPCVATDGLLAGVSTRHTYATSLSAYQRI